MLELSEEAKRLTSTFLRYRNHIDIYTEDEAKDKEFYTVLFKKLIKDDILINDITPLGSKEAVKNRCLNEPENGRKKLFIIDGDISIIHGEKPTLMKNLFVLDAYCIENFLFDRDTLIHFIYLSCAIKSKEDITKEVDFDNWLNEYTEAFIDLFIHFSIVDILGGRFMLFNANKYHIKDKDNLVFSPDLVLKDINALKVDILKNLSYESYIGKYSELRQKWTNCIDTLFTVVSGKDYLIPILLIKSQRFKRSKALPTLEEVKMSLVQVSNLDRLKNLKATIESL